LIQNNIIEIYQKKLKELINIPNNEKIKKILKSLIFSISNLCVGPVSQTKKIILSEIPNFLFSISKITKCNDVLLEIIITFSNLLFYTDQEGIVKLMKFNPIRIFCEGIKHSNKEEIINHSIMGINSIILSSNFFESEEIKEIEIEINSITPIINNLAFGKNKEIADKADKLLKKYGEFKKYKKNIEFNTYENDTIMKMDN